MNPKRVKARQQRKEARKLDKAPITDLTRSARQQLIAADVLSLEATRMRMASATKGAFGTRSLRAAGSTSNYIIGATPSTLTLPKTQKAPRTPPPGRSTRPPTRRTPPSQGQQQQRTTEPAPRQTTVRSHVVKSAPIPKLNAPKGAPPQSTYDPLPVAPKPLTLPPVRTYYGGGR